MRPSAALNQVTRTFGSAAPDSETGVMAFLGSRSLTRSPSVEPGAFQRTHAQPP